MSIFFIFSQPTSKVASLITFHDIFLSAQQHLRTSRTFISPLVTPLHVHFATLENFEILYWLSKKELDSLIYTTMIITLLGTYRKYVLWPPPTLTTVVQWIQEDCPISCRHRHYTLLTPTHMHLLQCKVVWWPQEKLWPKVFTLTPTHTYYSCR